MSVSESDSESKSEGLNIKPEVNNDLIKDIVRRNYDLNVVNNLKLNGYDDLNFLYVLRNAKTDFLRCIGYLSFTKHRIKHDLLQTQVLVLQLNFLNY